MKSPRRRLTFAMLNMASQLLLLALSVAWTIVLIVIAVRGAAYFVEGNRTVLYGEIAATTLIAILAAYVFVLQLRRLGESRRSDDRRGERRGQSGPLN